MRFLKKNQVSLNSRVSRSAVGLTLCCYQVEDLNGYIIYCFNVCYGPRGQPSVVVIKLEVDPY